MNNKVCIIIVTWNKKSDVVALLRSIYEGVYTHFDVIVVDNDSQDDTVESIRHEFFNVRIIEHNQNLGGAGGFASGLNEAISLEKYQYYWLLDNDVLVRPGTLKFLVETSALDDSVGVVGSKIYKMGTKEIQECGGIVDFNSLKIRTLRSGEREEFNVDSTLLEADFVPACSFLVKDSVIRSVGVIDQKLFVFFDDIEWGFRIKRAGWRVVCDQRSIIEHCFHGDKPDLSWKVYYRTRNRLNFYQLYSYSVLSLKYLQLINNELAYWYSYWGLNDMHQAILNAQEDFSKGVWGKWSRQPLGQQFSNYHEHIKYPSKPNGIYLHAGKLHLELYQSDDGFCHIVLTDWRSYLRALCCFFMSGQQKILVSYKPHIFLFLCNAWIINYDTYGVLIKNKRLQSMKLLMSRGVVFACKYIYFRGRLFWSKIA